MRIPCARCGIEHDLSDLEPSFQRPDAVDEVPSEVRAGRVTRTRNFCRIDAGEAGGDLYFVRALLPFRVDGDTTPCSWGLWLEVTRVAHADIYRLWDDAGQLDYGPWPGLVANQVPGYPPTRGLLGMIRFATLDEIPHCEFVAGQDHPFVKEWLAGVSVDRVRDWQMNFLHA